MVLLLADNKWSTVVFLDSPQLDLILLICPKDRDPISVLEQDWGLYKNLLIKTG